MSLYLFPAAFMANSFAMMLVMIGLSLFGQPMLAAEFGLIHAASVALFNALSGNARSLILSGAPGVDAAAILRLRLLLLLPLSILVFALSIGLIESGWLFALLLVGRRAAEWLAELFLGEHELQQRSGIALRSLLTQAAASLLLLLALVMESHLATLVLAFWAISPLLWCGRLRASDTRQARGALPATLRTLLPHLASSSVIGTAVYVFRLLLLLLAGKQVAGDLFAAFAIGGILGTVFAQALGPTLVHHEGQGRAASRLERLLARSMQLSLLTGLSLAALALWQPALLDWTGKDGLFWLAVGCSLVGGVVMVHAQRTRLRILQDGSGRDVFGSDLLANMLLIGCVPLLYFSIGPAALPFLYLLGALFSLMFYASEGKDCLAGETGMLRSNERWVLPALALALFLPLFFQLSTGVFRDPSRYFSSGGDFRLLPIPLSVLACYAGILLLGGYARARLALASIFLIFVGMLLTTVLLASLQGSYERAKLILLVQFMLPMFALVLGQQYAARQNALEWLARVLFWLLLLIVPLQLASTLWRGSTVLSPSLYLFSIYQHLQYAPVLFAGAFLIALYGLWQQPFYRRWLLLLGAVMGLYTALSVAVLAVGLLVIGVLVFALRQCLCREQAARAVLLGFLVIASLLLGFLFVSNAKILYAKLGGLLPEALLSLLEMLRGAGGKLPDADAQTQQNVAERLFFWRYYFAGISESWTSLLLGHDQAPDRELYPSAHNYYLDFTYNFGLLALLPLLGLIAFTLQAALRRMASLWKNPALLGLTGVALFLLLADNNLKVGMRQPYAGIITFFLWGMLLNYLATPGQRPASPGDATRLHAEERTP